MSATTHDEWRRLVAEYEAAAAIHDADWAQLDGADPASAVEDEAERRCAASLDHICELEDRLLALTAPSAAAAVYQLKVFGLRYLSVDLDDRPEGPDAEPEGPIFRRIFGVLDRATTQSQGLV